MNGLEKRIFNGAVRAQSTYRRMAGWWLWHAPESFLQHEIARSICRSNKGFDVFTEASPKKIVAEHDEPLRGRPPGKEHQMQRFDVVVWQKSAAKVRAIIEVKRGTGVDIGVIKDARKLRKYLKGKNALGRGYLLFYSEASGRKRIEHLRNRVEAIQKQLKASRWRLVRYTIRPKGGSEDKEGRVWSWLMCLMRVSKA